MSSQISVAATEMTRGLKSEVKRFSPTLLWAILRGIRSRTRQFEYRVVGRPVNPGETAKARAAVESKKA